MFPMKQAECTYPSDQNLFYHNRFINRMMHPSNYQNLSPAEAIAYQHELKKLIRIEKLHTGIKTIAGADVSFNKNSEIVYAGIIVLSYPQLTEIDRSAVISKTKFPYISGLLAFREIPSLLEAWEKLNIKPDLVVLDGQGIAHERRTGIATHFGLLTDVPAIGCAKSRLTGSFEEPENVPFAESPIYSHGEVVGAALRTKRNCKPVYISPGHRVDLTQSIAIIKQCVGKHRIPEPTRKAHLLVNDVRIHDMESPAAQQKLF